MRKCPVCEQSSESLLCSNCGFDESKNFELYPTFGNHIASTKAISALQVTWKKEHEEETCCRVCGDHRFVINRNTGKLRCLCCHTPLEQQLEASEPAVNDLSPSRPTRKFTGLKIPQDGCTVIAAGYNADGRCDVGSWKNIIALSVSDRHTLGLSSDGTVVATGRNDALECFIKRWSGITSIAAIPNLSCGLQADGKIVHAGLKLENFDVVNNWTNLKSLIPGKHSLFGLTKTGKVFSTDPYCKAVENWENIISVAGGQDLCIGLQQDGTVVLAGNPRVLCQFRTRDWHDIVAVAGGDRHVVGLKADGTVVATGENFFGQCDVEHWHNIVAVAAGGDLTAGLCADGTVVCTRQNLPVSDWKWIAAIAVADDHIVGLQLTESQYQAQQRQ